MAYTSGLVYIISLGYMLSSYIIIHGSLGINLVTLKILVFSLVNQVMMLKIPFLYAFNICQLINVFFLLSGKILKNRIVIQNRGMKAMAFPVMEFQDQGYKIRKIFAKKSTYTKEIIEF